MNYKTVKRVSGDCMGSIYIDLMQTYSKVCVCPDSLKEFSTDLWQALYHNLNHEVFISLNADTYSINYYLENLPIDNSSYYRVYKDDDGHYCDQVLPEVVPAELKEMASKICELSQCGYIREYFDDHGIYKSPTLFNFFACCEEVTSEIESGHYKKAEEMVNAYYKEI